MAAPRSGADGIDRSIRITKSLLDHLVCWAQATWMSRHESSPRPRRARDGRKCHALPPAIRQPRLGWIGTAGHVIPPAAQLAMAQHAQAYIVKVDASHLSMISHPQR
jgi:pimeloyl-ACP methyl ester carboxylesterase